MVYRYTLEKYKGPCSRYTCPGCGKTKVFTRYIDGRTGKHLAHHVGRCSRESKCGYHYKPRQYFQEQGIEKPKPVYYRQPQARKPVSFIADDIFKDSLKGYEQNCLVQYLQRLFDVDLTRQLIARYFIGSSNHWTGATVFWQIDAKGKIRTGKIMLYSPITGKRVKEPYNHITWVHSAMKQNEYKVRQCFFGEHLLRSDPQKPVAIVESEKTAIIASVYLPDFIWVAVGGIMNLNEEKCKVLAGRTVIMYPDLKAFEKWKAKAAELSHLARFTVSDLLESKASDADIQQGYDLADFLIRLPVPGQPHVQAEPPQLTDLFVADLQPAAGCRHLIKKEKDFSDTEKKARWEQEVEELDQYFNSITMPSFPVRLNGWTHVTNISETIKTHLATVRANDGNKTFLPFLNRLQEMKMYLSNIK